MGDKSKIEWTDATWNPVTGCTKVSAGCKNCYAERLFPRVYGKSLVHLSTGLVAATPAAIGGHYRPRKFTDIQVHENRLDQPLRWKKPRMVFVNSMSDLFHPDVPDKVRDQVFAVMALCPQHTFQVLTKRPEGMNSYCGSDETLGRLLRLLAEATQDSPVVYQRIDHKSDGLKGFALPNVWMGVSVEDQATADERIPVLLQTPAAVRFVSYEPALAGIDFSPFFGYNPNHGEDTEKRRGSLPGSIDRDAGDRPAGENLADQEQNGKSVDGQSGRNSMPSSPSREQDRSRISANQSDVCGDAAQRNGASAGVETFPRPNPGGSGHQPQEREENGQSPGKPGSIDRIGKSETRSERAGNSQSGESMGRGQQFDEIDNHSGGGNQEKEGGGREVEQHSEGLRNSIPDRFQDSQERASISWVICGGESGPKARHADPEWFRSVRDQCKEAGISFFMKQMTKKAPIPEDLMIREYP